MNATRFLTIVLVLSACREAAPPPFKPVADVKQIMTAVLEPAADHYWDAVGWIVDEKGVVAIEPRTPMQWDSVRNDAFVVAESGNLLMIGTRARDQGDWMKFSQDLAEAGQRAMRAAESRDKQAVFDAGAEVYYACTACHEKYVAALRRPGSP
jgi:hypothetical protein